MNAETLWIAAGVLAGLLSAFGGWMLVNERRMGKFMTRDEHERICDRRNEEVRTVLTRIEANLAKSDQQAMEHRHKVNGVLTTVQLDVAVIKERLKHTHGEWGEQ